MLDPVPATAEPQVPKQGTTAEPTPPAPQAQAPTPPPAQEPVEFLSKEDQEVLKNSFIKEGDEFVYKSPDTSTIYRGKTPGEVIQQLLKGVAEKDRIIEESRSRTPRPQVSFSRPGTQQDPAEPQAEDFDAPKPPDEQQIRQKVYEESMRELPFEPKYLKFTPEDWKALENELGVASTLNLMQQKEKFISSYEQKVQVEKARQSTQYANEVLGNEAIDSIFDSLKDERIELDTPTFDRLWDKAYLQENVWTKDGRLLPARVALNFMKLARSEKSSAPATPSPVRQALNQDGTPKVVPPGVTAPPPGPAPATPPPKTPPQNLDEAFEKIKAGLPRS